MATAISLAWLHNQTQHIYLIPNTHTRNAITVHSYPAAIYSLLVEPHSLQDLFHFALLHGFILISPYAPYAHAYCYSC